MARVVVYGPVRRFRPVGFPPGSNDAGVRDDGKVLWNLRKPWRDGTRAFVFDPLATRDCGSNTSCIDPEGALGSFSLALDLSALPQASVAVAVQPGETWYFQAWHRDSNPTSTSNLTDALRVSFH